jgi:beta-galactosidase
VTGEAELKALGTGNPTQMESVTDTTTHTFRGHALAILRSTGKSGRANLTVSSPGLPDVTVAVTFTQP